MTPSPHEATSPKAVPETGPARPASTASQLLILGVLLALGVGGYFAYTHFHAAGPSGAGAPAAAKPAARPLPVVAARVRKGEMNLYLTGLGTVTALNTVTLRSRVDGQLDKVAFTEGQLVREGELLFEIDPRPFQVQLAQMEAQLSRDQALLANSKTDLERFQQAKNAVSAQQLVTQMSVVSQFEASLRSDQAQIDNAKLQLVYSRISSPITGRIGLRLVDRGNMVRANDQTGLAVVTQTQPISVVFSLPEDSIRTVLPKIRKGDVLSVDAYDRDLTTRLASGTVLAIDNQVDPSTGTVRIKAVFPNEMEALFSNQFVNARLLTDIRKEALIIPSAALQRTPLATFVYVVKLDPAAPSDGAPPAGGSPKGDSPGGGPGKTEAPKMEGVVETRNVTPGPSEGEETILEGGVGPGDLVVTDGVDKLVPGARVTVRLARPARGGKNAP